MKITNSSRTKNLPYKSRRRGRSKGKGRKQLGKETHIWRACKNKTVVVRIYSVDLIIAKLRSHAMVDPLRTNTFRAISLWQTIILVLHMWHHPFSPSFIMELKIHAWCGHYFFNTLYLFYYMFELWIFFFEYSDLDMDINKKELREDGSRKGFSHDIRKCSHWQEKKRNNATRILSFARNHVLACIYDMTKFVDIHVFGMHL